MNGLPVDQNVWVPPDRRREVGVEVHGEGVVAELLFLLAAGAEVSKKKCQIECLPYKVKQVLPRQLHRLRAHVD